MKKVIYIFFLLFFTGLPCVFGQKKEISQAKEFVKRKNNLEKAEQLMRDLLKDSANQHNEKIWELLSSALLGQYYQANEKLYLKQQIDTATLFLPFQKLYHVYIHVDSMEMIPNKQGNVKPKYRKEHSETIHRYRPNLYNGGIYFFTKEKYAEAYSFFDDYITSANEPLMIAYRYNEQDTLIPRAAYWAVACGYMMKDTQKTLHHTYQALKDTAHFMKMLQYLAETYRLDGDTVRYEATLQEGFQKYPVQPYFFTQLNLLYSLQGNWDKALALAEQAFQFPSNRQSASFAKAQALFHLGKYKQSIAICDTLIREDSTFADAYLCAGISYYNQAIDFDKQMQRSKKIKNQIQENYQQALRYLGTYRRMCPDKKESWLQPLYTIYLNLNMGKEFDEINNIMKDGNK